MRSLPVLVLLLLSGCASPAGPTPTTDATADGVDPWAGAQRLLIQETGGTVTMFDAACRLGGAPILERGETRVLPGTSHLEVAVSVDGAMTPLQAGYARSDSERGGVPAQDAFTWLAPVGTGEAATFQVPVAPDETEEPAGAAHWFFSYRNNPGVDALCYTGGGKGAFSVLVEAVRGPPA